MRDAIIITEHAELSFGITYSMHTSSLSYL